MVAGGPAEATDKVRPVENPGAVTANMYKKRACCCAATHPLKRLVNSSFAGARLATPAVLTILRDGSIVRGAEYIAGRPASNSRSMAASSSCGFAAWFLYHSIVIRQCRRDTTI